MESGSDAMYCSTTGPATMHGIARSAIVFITCTLVAALLLLPFALQQPSTSGPSGLAVAAAICLASGLIAEGLGLAVGRVSPLGGTLIGMLIRMIVPLGVCIAMLAMGFSGHEHLAFISYLLTFYLLTLAVGTWLAVQRASAATLPSQHSNQQVA